eukprot:2216951-Heterocapsa_arctica.AAC.1
MRYPHLLRHKPGQEAVPCQWTDHTPPMGRGGGSLGAPARSRAQLEHGARPAITRAERKGHAS